MKNEELKKKKEKQGPLWAKRAERKTKNNGKKRRKKDIDARPLCGVNGNSLSWEKTNKREGEMEREKSRRRVRSTKVQGRGKMRERYKRNTQEEAKRIELNDYFEGQRCFIQRRKKM